jgi:hypothetical protein
VSPGTLFAVKQPAQQPDAVTPSEPEAGRVRGELIEDAARFWGVTWVCSRIDPPTTVRSG